MQRIVADSKAGGDNFAGAQFQQAMSSGAVAVRPPPQIAAILCARLDVGGVDHTDKKKRGDRPGRAGQQAGR